MIDLTKAATSRVQEPKAELWLRGQRFVLEGLALWGGETGLGVYLKDGTPPDLDPKHWKAGKALAAPGPTLVLVICGPSGHSLYQHLSAEAERLAPVAPAVSAPKPKRKRLKRR